MYYTKLKEYRAHADKSCSEMATALGVTETEYLQWENGVVPIPKDSLRGAAGILNVSKRKILGKEPRIRVHDIQDVAIHFCNGGKPLLLSVSLDECNDIRHQISNGKPYLIVKSLANQTVIIRTKAIADLQNFDTDDDPGLDYEKYSYTNLVLPDMRDWEIIERLVIETDLEGFDEVDVMRVMDRIEEYESPDEQHDLDALCFSTFYQLSTGQMQALDVDDQELSHLVMSFDVAEKDGGVNFTGDAFLLLRGAYGRDAFLNTRAFDYITVPTHRYERGATDNLCEIIDFAPYRNEQVG